MVAASGSMPGKGQTQQSNNGFYQHYYQGHSCLSTPCSEVRKLSSSLLSLVPFEMLPQRWRSEQASLSVSKFMHGSFKRIALGLTLPSISLSDNRWGFHSQNFWEILFLTLEPCAGEPVLGLGPLTPPEGPLQPRYASYFPSFNCYLWLWDQSVPCLCPSYQSQGGFFCISLGLSFS